MPVPPVLTLANEQLIPSEQVELHGLEILVIDMRMNRT
jgi:hypothetical protein